MASNKQKLIQISPQQLERVVERVVAERLQLIVEQETMTVTAYSGPLPPAAETQKYEGIHPGFTNRWITMAEMEQQERFKTITRRDWFQIVYKISSLAAGSFLVVGLVAGGIYLLANGRSLEGFGSITVAAVAIFGAAIFRKVGAPPPTPGKE